MKKTISVNTFDLISVYESLETARSFIRQQLENQLHWKDLAMIGLTVPAISKYRKENNTTLMEAKEQVEKYVKTIN